MSTLYDKGKKEYIERGTKKLTSIYNIIKDNPLFFINSDIVEELYHLIKQIRDSSAIFKDINVYNSATILLKKFNINGVNYELRQENAQIVYEGLNLLLRKLISGESKKVEFANINNFISSKNDKKNLLILDSDVFFYEWIKEFLSNTESNIYSINTANDVIPTILKHNISLIIIDMMIPDRKGFETVKSIRNNKLISNIPILATTHNHNENHIIDIINLGVDDIIEKPVSARYFMSLLRNVYSRRNLACNSYSPFFFKNQREEMSKLISKEWIRFLRFQSYFSLLIVKLDLYEKHFDNLGVESVLCFMSNLYDEISKSIRPYDEVKMWSVDSYMLLLPATRIDGATLVGKRLINKFKNNNQILDSNIIVGGIESKTDYETPEDLIKRLEKELSYADSDKVYVVESAKSQNKTSEDKKCYRILIIDDDPVPSTILTNHFKSEEWEIDVCSNSLSAMERTLEFKPEIIICETRLDNLDGFSFCYQVRQFPNFKDLIFIFLSKQVLTSSIVRGFQVGADDYIIKPFSVYEVEARIKRYIQRLKKQVNNL